MFESEEPVSVCKDFSWVESSRDLSLGHGPDWEGRQDQDYEVEEEGR